MRSIASLLIFLTPVAVAADGSLMDQSRQVCKALDLAYGMVVSIDSAYVAEVALAPEMKQKFLDQAVLTYRGPATIGPSVKALALRLYSDTLAVAPRRFDDAVKFLKQMGGETGENVRRARIDAYNGDFLTDCMYELGRMEGQGKLREFLSLRASQ